jgi:heme oxygenase (biliverdin-producing, ferredoxin)
LAQALREGTAALHRQAERAGVMGELLRGRVTRGGYTALLRNLHALYRKLEAHLTRLAVDPAIARVWLPELAREAALAGDLEALYGADWEREIPLQRAMVRYLERLDELAQATPRLLLAHVYVRYLGDLSGGQIVRRVIASAFALGEDPGQAFYRFAEAPERLAARLRAALDAIELMPHECAQLVDEARLAFDLHIALFEELAEVEAHWASVPPPA